MVHFNRDLIRLIQSLLHERDWLNSIEISRDWFYSTFEKERFNKRINFKTNEYKEREIIKVKMLHGLDFWDGLLDNHAAICTKNLESFVIPLIKMLSKKGYDLYFHTTGELKDKHRKLFKEVYCNQNKKSFHEWLDQKLTEKKIKIQQPHKYEPEYIIIDHTDFWDGDSFSLPTDVEKIVSLMNDRFLDLSLKDIYANGRHYGLFFIICSSTFLHINQESRYHIFENVIDVDYLNEVMKTPEIIPFLKETEKYNKIIIFDKKYKLDCNINRKVHWFSLFENIRQLSKEKRKLFYENKS